MSKIEVDAIDKQSGSTLTLGGSGTAVTLACGATQTGFGRTGTVDWDTTPKTATFTAVNGTGYFVNTTAGVITVNLPAGSAGNIVSLADYAGTWQTNNVTVTPNGTDKIGGINTSVTLDTEGQSVTFVFVDSTQGWINTMDSTSNERGATFICASVSGACNTLVTAPDCANVKIATFVGPGTFCVSQISSTPANNEVSYTVVAGGGGGGAGSSGSIFGGGGGGAGGFREVSSPVSPFTASPLDGYSTPGNRITLTATAFPITVGAGGSGACKTSPSSPNTRIGTNGVNSTFSTITSAGGGVGGSRNTNGSGGPAVNFSKGAAGGSGGGSTEGPPGGWLGGAGNTPPTTPAQGSTGGASAPSDGGTFSNIAGGGGATQSGQPGGGTSGGDVGGAGGTGATNTITASPVARSGGGGAGGTEPNGAGGAGGTGGGAAGGTNAGGAGVPGAVGTTNTGGGGGGGSGRSSGCGSDGGNGGSGIVIIRYKFQ
ncbi:hypothetical protein N9182_00135 [bacterium]|nr:hypothetical protein [bacterium]